MRQDIFKKVITSMVFISVLFFQGCALWQKSETVKKTSSAEKIYLEAKDALESENYRLAIENYEYLETRYPFSDYATVAHLEIIDAYYQHNEPEASIAAAERFIRLHPTHPKVDYAYYAIGLAHHMMQQSFLQRFLPIDISKRDQSETREAFSAFARFVKRFPESDYATDAKKRMVHLRNSLAQHEAHIANHYVEKGAFVAASNRAKYIIEHYPKTPAVPYALSIQVQSYVEMGLTDLAKNNLELLRINYPTHPALATAEKAYTRL